MKIKEVLFDLDGTLLPMDLDVFTKTYMKMLAKKAAAFGYEPKKFTDTVWAGTYAMIKNDGSKTNENAFWDVFVSAYGEEKLCDKAVFDEFYLNEFQNVREFCGYNPNAAKTVRKIRAAGYKTAVATSPFFPHTATESRIRWAGLSPDEFDFFTSYEDTYFCKPSLGYYEDVLKRTGLSAKECLMVGNDTGDDMVAAKLGMNVFLLTDCLINSKNEDIGQYPHGGFAELEEFLKLV